MKSLTVANLGKAFRNYHSVAHKLRHWLVPGQWGAPPELTWVLKGVNFSVDPGEAVGVVGMNGAGKSTLLKIIAGTMAQTEGAVRVNGKVAALLELGMGFHPEFTGRQNAILGAQLQGHSASDIDELLPSIKEFAEIGEYFDRPLRTYSSGMQMRLAFSVATARRPDILIVDEALSVGDAYFQHKSFDRIRELRQQGTTLLIVSHSPFAIQAICDRAIMLADGRVVREGRPDEVMDYYNAALADQTRSLIQIDKQLHGGSRTTSGTREVVVTSVRLIDENGTPVEMLHTGQRVKLEISVIAKADVPSLVLGFLIRDSLGQHIYGVNTYRLGEQLEGVKQGSRFVFAFEFPANLGKGHYSISLSLSGADSHLGGNYEWTDRALLFHVVNTSHEDFVGCSWLGATVAITSNDGAESEEAVGEHTDA
ncbi:ABC transporter ATP-binding protein [Gilvimarinus sp. F26214L]|uniref:ABC transporter ATP-binding protein n=1 Tax=Gilvimarinus sp. DZF01 TaxID=3461371 RepID=UPI0040452A1D